MHLYSGLWTIFFFLQEKGYITVAELEGNLQWDTERANRALVSHIKCVFRVNIDILAKLSQSTCVQQLPILYFKLVNLWFSGLAF